MIQAAFFGVPGLGPESFDQSARDLNQELLSEAWRYPAEDREDLEPRLRELFGDDATIVRAGSALRVTAAALPQKRLEAIARELASLDTRVLFVKAETSVEVLVYFQNPHGYGPRSRPLLLGRELRGKDDVRAASGGTCPCGAKHVAFTSSKAYGGQETDDVPIACLRCGRSTLLVLGVAGGAEVHLADELPLSRIRWLPAHEDYAPSRSDYAWWQRALTSIWLPAAGGVALGVALVLLLQGSLPGSNGGSASPSPATPPGSASRSTLGSAHLVANDAGMSCNQRECVLARLEDLKAMASDAGATAFLTELEEVRRRLDAGECARALELGRAIKDPEDTRFAATRVQIAHLSFNLVLDNHCRFLRARAAEPAADQGGGSGSVGSETTAD